jgi:hypothetical protein
MKTGFKRPDEIKKQHPPDQPKEGKSSPWDYRQPQYDERSSCYVKAGTDYGIAHRQPVGHHGNPKQRVDTMPFGRPATLYVGSHEV